ncbi:MAG: SH3 domain-containing protein, partial [Anaerolineae bacterium]|nr:SH3 domain-containing protein [Anaerolineae bacterium]
MKIAKRLALVALVVLLTVSLVPVASAQEPVQAQVIASQLNVRQLPTLSAPILGTYPFGTLVVLDGREDLTDNGVWVRATQAGGGLSGWVFAEYLSFITGSVEALPVVQVAPASGNAPAPQSAPAASDGSVTGTIRNTSNLRGGPDTSFPRIGGAARGTSASFSGRNAAGDWLFGTVGGQQAWIAAFLVNVRGNVGGLPVAHEPPVGRTSSRAVQRRG